MNKKLNLLPDSGLPIEEEVDRNAENIINGMRKALEATCDNVGFQKEDRELAISSLKELIKKKIRPEIEKRRSNESAQ